MNLYVPLDHMRGLGPNEKRGVIEKMASVIGAARATSRFSTQVLAGHRGSGKSTEMVRLKTLLEQDTPA